MKRRAVILALALLMAIAAVGCSSPASVSEWPVPFEVVAESAWPPEVDAWVADATRNRAEPYQAERTFGDKTYLLVYGGTLPSEGYQVKFKEMEEHRDKVTVTAAIVGPSKPFSSRMEAPRAVARIASNPGPFEFRVTTEAATARE